MSARAKRHPEFLGFEHRRDPLLPHHLFVKRLVRHVAYSVAAITVALGIGVLGYRYLCGLGWLDSLVNASMILGGLGPVDPIQTARGKWFASFYALFSGVVFLGAAGVLFAPLFHRLLHHFHLELEEERSETGKRG